MLDELRRTNTLYQEDVVFAIEEKFGEPFFYLNDAGNPAIAKSVLSAFRKLTEDTVVWERGERAWRMREPHDEKGRQQL